MQALVCLQLACMQTRTHVVDWQIFAHLQTTLQLALHAQDTPESEPVQM